MALVSQLRFEEFRSLAKAGLAWWWQGLSDWIPEHKRLSAKNKKPILIMAGYRQTTLIIPVDDAAAATPADHIQLPNLFDDASEETLTALASHCKGHIVEISLDPQDILLLDMTLPKTAQFKLRDAVSFKLITESPLDRESLYFDIGTKPSTDADSIRLDIALCLRQKVDHVRDALERAGIDMIRIGCSTSLPPSLDFVFYASPAIASARSRLKKHLMLLLSLMLITTAFLPITFLAASWLERDIRQENKSMQQSLDTNTQLLARRARLDSLKSDLNKQIPPHRLTTVLNDLATALPKTSWISSIRYDKGVLQLTGNSPDIVETMRALEKQATLGHVKLISVANANNPNNANTASQFEVAIDFHR